MIGAIYRTIDNAWHKVLENPITGAILRVPVVMTENECGTCHWWRGAVLGAGVALFLTGHLITGVILCGAVLGICTLQMAADRETKQASLKDGD